jgi:hypothetical protein
MSKKSKTTQADTTAELVVLESATTIQPVEPAEIDAEVAADNEKKKSVVLPKYKHRYAERAANAGIAKKAAQRSAWDWLAQTLAAQCLDERQRIDIAKFTRILEMNGVDHSRWTNRSKGWEGRFRMTCLASRKFSQQEKPNEDRNRIKPSAEHSYAAAASRSASRADGFFRNHHAHSRDEAINNT